MPRGGKAARVKGNAGERELVKLLDGARIRGRVLTARRVPLSGSMKESGFGGDLLVGEQGPLQILDGHGKNEKRFEVKRRAHRFKSIDRYLEDNFAVVYRRDRGEWIITMRVKDWIE